MSDLPIDSRRTLNSNLKDEMKSDSEESRQVRTRYPTVRYVDQTPTLQRSRSLLRKRKRVQQRLSQLEELKRQDRASEPDLSKPDPSDTQTQPTERVPTNSSDHMVDDSFGGPTQSNEP